MTEPRPQIQVFYDNQDVTSDISDRLISFTYRDKVSGETDELELVLEDVDGLWRDAWYPKKGAKLSAKMGYDGELVDCGTFEIDEIELSGPPDVVSIRAVAAAITSKMRTKNSKGNENITLKQLAEDIAGKHGLTLDDGTHTIKGKYPSTTDEQAQLHRFWQYARELGNEGDNSKRYLGIAGMYISFQKTLNSLKGKGYTDICELIVSDVNMLQANMTRENCARFAMFLFKIETVLIQRPLDFSKTVSLGLHKIKLERSTQYRETDLEYLKRISFEYGFAFTIKGEVMVFYNIKQLEESPAVLKFSRGDGQIKSYSLRDKTMNTVKSATVKSHNPRKQELITKDITSDDKTAENGDSYNEITKEDSVELRVRAENEQQAEAKAKAAVHNLNSTTQEGSISFIGTPFMLAGSNFELSDMGRLSGKWHVTESTHAITKGGGYVTDVEVKRVSRFSGDGAPSKAAASAPGRRGDTGKEEDLIMSLAKEAYASGQISEADSRMPRVDDVLKNAEKIVQLLYNKNCNLEASQMQSNIQMLSTFKSTTNCFRFSTYCYQIRKELMKSRK